MREKHSGLINNTSQWIRIIGDPVLHQPGLRFPLDASPEDHLELNRQINIAKSILIKTGGGGIAANQCVEIQRPYQFAIVGVFHESEEHVAGVTRRYPSAVFPQAMIMVNPIILEQSSRMQKFDHGCLSVPCPNRCAIQSPEELTVQYLDPGQDMKSVTLTLGGSAAIALWHEMNHILDGKTYIDTALAALNDSDFNEFEFMIAEELNRRELGQVTPEIILPPFYFSITIEHNSSRLNKEALSHVVPKMTPETLKGINLRCKTLRNTWSSASEELAEKSLTEELIKRVERLEEQVNELKNSMPSEETSAHYSASPKFFNK
ncbi:peptide deformylase [Legionella quateirensis]|uniref:Peptide deformylase n=1 Tax=Legionella quateirensis TaxID=45072 RepID=A0A378KV22_9GAMM|nr:peptide deformylase [Legionella quateirensis]KTD43665.1 Peptide deformylase [Legionella quateirensis]STY17347.1 Peptide deformylase [Legionella quateirensis]